MDVHLTLWPWLILVIVYGACIGSFLNVVIYRLPAGKSLWQPPSHCPNCEKKLAWHDNVPVLAWFYLRGRCRHCRTPISLQYPLVEAVTALLFAGLFATYYISDLRPGFSNEGLGQTWPVLIVHLALGAALLAATVVDARLFIIPMDIPNFVTVLALIALPLTVAWFPDTEGASPHIDGLWLAATAGGLIGLGLALLMLWRRVLPRSFDEQDESEGASDDDSHGIPAQWLAHPHPRREILKECLYVLWPLAGAIVGYLLASQAGWGGALTNLPLPVHVAGGVLWGYMVGAAAIWATRILGTLGFGKEAMGLGDVHLLASIGAVLGWRDAVVVFFIAPFAGLMGAVVVAGLGRLAKGEGRVIPYGPYLAAAVFLWVVFQGPLKQMFAMLYR